MTTTTTLYDTCEDLFARYPLAVRNVTEDGTVRSMTLVAPGARYSVLVADTGQEVPFFTLGTWGPGPSADIERDGTLSDSGADVSAITEGTPLPRDGSMLGWTDRGRVGALILSWTAYSPEMAEPSWSLMLPVGPSAYPHLPIADRRPMGAWVWEGLAGGSVADLSGLIGESPGGAFWADLDPGDGNGSGCIVVPADVTDRAGLVLPAARYAFGLAAEDRARVPSLEALLADPAKVDLAPRFQHSNWA